MQYYTLFFLSLTVVPQLFVDVIFNNRGKLRTLRAFEWSFQSNDCHIRWFFRGKIRPPLGC